MGFVLIFGLVVVGSIVLIAALLKNIEKHTPLKAIEISLLILTVVFCIFSIWIEFEAYGENVITQAEMAVVNFEKGRVKEINEYGQVVNDVAAYNGAVKESVEHPRNFWNGRLLRKFEELRQIELPEEFYESYMKCIKDKVMAK